MTDTPMTDRARIGFELAVERHIDAPPAIVWRAWTERTAQWWAPQPWSTQIIALDLRAGGRMAMMMRGPDGGESPAEGVFLEVTEHARIVFTDAFSAGWIPQAPFMLGFFELAPEGAGTRYRAGARHWDEAAMKQHEGMDFIHGWGVVAGQLAQIAEAMARS